MEDREEFESSFQNEKMTRPFVLSVVGSCFVAIQFGYMSYLITNPIVFMTLWEEGMADDTGHFKFLLLLPTFAPLGGLFGVLLWGCLADRYGRKSAILINNGISIFSSAFLSFDKIIHHFAYSFFARFFVGISTGAFTYSFSLYILEISPLNIRGAMVTILTLSYTWGYVLVQILTNPKIWGNDENYALLVGVIAVFAIISSIFLVYSPETPRFLYLQQNDEEEARKVLMNLRGEEDVEEELEELQQEQLAGSSQENMTVWKLLRFRSLRWHVITVVVLIAGSRLMQPNAIVIFANQSHKTLKLPTKTRWLLVTLGSVVIHLMLMTTICIVESLGRRFLILSGFLISIISSIGVVFAFQNDKPAMALLGLVMIFLFFTGYVMGPESIVPVIIGELFLQSSRASAYAIAGFVSWGIQFLSALMFLLTKSYLESYYLLIYWPFMILAFIYIFWVVPDTSGITFQEIQEKMEASTFRKSRKIEAE